MAAVGRDGPASVEPVVSTPRRPPLAEGAWKKTLVLLLAGAALLAAAIGSLQVDAGARAARWSREARAASLRAMARSSSALLRYAYERDRLASFEALETEWLMAHEQAVASEAVAHARSANRLFETMEATRSMSTLLSAPYFDEQTFAADVVQFNVDYFTIPTVLASEQDEAFRTQAQAWEKKADRYVVALIVLTLSLFLLGLAMATEQTARRLFALAGCGIMAGLVAFVAATALVAPAVVAEGSLVSYANAAGHLTYASYVAPSGEGALAVQRARQAIDLASEAIAVRPTYAAAFELRAMARLLVSQESAEFSSPVFFAAAVADFDRAIVLGRDSGALEDLRARALFFAGETEKALRAAERAVVLSPEYELRFGLHLALLLLGAGRETDAMDVAEQAFAWAEEHPLSSDPLTFRETIYILDRLAELNGPAREALETRIKEASVSLIHYGRGTPPPLSARLGEPSFSLAEGTQASKAFPRGSRGIVMNCSADGLLPGVSLVGLVFRDGIEQPSLGWEEIWSGDASGTLRRTLGAMRGMTVPDLLPGAYAVEIYVDGALAAHGAFSIE